jgi:hypothetical protein
MPVDFDPDLDVLTDDELLVLIAFGCLVIGDNLGSHSLISPGRVGAAAGEAELRGLIDPATRAYLFTLDALVGLSTHDWDEEATSLSEIAQSLWKRSVGTRLPKL